MSTEIEDDKDKKKFKPDQQMRSELTENIKKWIELDNDISRLNAELKHKKTAKKEITEKVVSVMKSNTIECFDINNGALIYKQRKTKKPITAKLLLEQLKRFYENQTEVATEITKQVLASRVEVVQEELVLKSSTKKS